MFQEEYQLNFTYLHQNTHTTYWNSHNMLMLNNGCYGNKKLCNFRAFTHHYKIFLYIQKDICVCVCIVTVNYIFTEELTHQRYNYMNCKDIPTSKYTHYTLKLSQHVNAWQCVAMVTRNCAISELSLIITKSFYIYRRIFVCVCVCASWLLIIYLLRN
jgi:hypothetical protein